MLPFHVDLVYSVALLASAGFSSAFGLVGQGAHRLAPIAKLSLVIPRPAIPPRATRGRNPQSF